MAALSQQLPEYDVVMGIFGVGKVLAPQLIAEIGDNRRFHSRKAITTFAELDAPPYKSGSIDVILKNSPAGKPVYQFLDKKSAEGKPYKGYLTAAANKFLRIYYAKVNEVLNA